MSTVVSSDHITNSKHLTSLECMTCITDR